MIQGARGLQAVPVTAGGEFHPAPRTSPLQAKNSLYVITVERLVRGGS
ncbi:hypothetical protein LMG33818_001536 [Halomonadaceae bacterium LMG 33818]